MKTLKLTDKEASVLREWTVANIAAYEEPSPLKDALVAVLAKLTTEPKAKSTSPSIKACVEAMETVLGTGSVALPAHPDSVWFAKISGSVKRQGLTVDDFVSMARVLESRGWQPPYSFERAVWGADRLLAEARDGRKKATGDFRQAPMELEEP